MSRRHLIECLQDVWRHMSILTKKILVKIVHVFLVTSLSFSNSQSFLRENLDILFNFFLSAEIKRVVWKEFMVTYFLPREWEENLDIASQNPHNCWRARLILKASFLSVDLRACLSVCWILCRPACLSVCQSKFLSCPSFFLVTSFFWVISGFWN